LVLAALAATAVNWYVFATSFYRIDIALGDTDDATRLSLVHDLLAGHGWYDQKITRLWPPHGVYMHWSRLLDGALAAIMWLLSRFVSPATAELWTRFAWPMAWMAPGAVAVVWSARTLGSRAAVYATALLIACDLRMFIQFLPGRVDHHNVQIVMTALAFAAAIEPRNERRNAIIAGLATALGLAIGLEALPFHALIGASYAVRLAADRSQGRATVAYGLTLALGAATFYALQTPPERWGLPFCDALAVNLVAGLAVAGVGLAACGAVAARIPRTGLILALGAVAVAAGFAYIGLDPACTRGPFADMDPRVRSFWFNHIQELQPWLLILFTDPKLAMHGLFMSVMALAGAIALIALRKSHRRWDLVLALTLAALGLYVGFGARRMQDYLFWCGTPVAGAGLGWVSDRFFRGGAIAATILSITLSPGLLVLDSYYFFDHPMAKAGAKPARPVKAPPPLLRDGCFDVRTFAPLKKLPTGVILSDIDFGPYVLALTRHSVIDAPYHRMSAAILAAHDALQTPPAPAEAKVRALGVTYVLDCPRHYTQESRGSLLLALRAHKTPAWLTLLSTPSDALQIYRVNPSSGAVKPGLPAQSPIG